ncbi:MAG: OmpH family outer membrane protein [Nitrospirota bacterium]|nr:OmpH family outer membrane protein [Nitrospirota bacterium]
MKEVSSLFSLKPSIRSLLTLGMLACFSIVFNLSTAGAASSFKVGLIDPQRVIEKSKNGQRALAILKEHASIRQKLLKADEEELKKLQEEGQNAMNVSDGEKKVLQEHFQRKFQDYQKRGQEFQQELAQKQKDMVLEYMKKIEAATKAVAQRHGFDLVLDKGSEATLKIAIYSKKGLDITDEVVREFNRRYK